ncbi:MAG: DUF2085 domain-containing protein [Candidatus Heimdallarchaeota archaeon]|nr:DUF2085 domain-containing protein [Candidatus Heimdallarchaeota archaeon]
MESEILPQNYIKVPKHKRIRFVACHKIPSRSFHWKGKPLICYRCLGIDAGIIIMFLLQVIGLATSKYNTGEWFFYIVNGNFWMIPIIIILSQIPFTLDGTLQAALEKYESKNSIRLVTGLIGGIGQYYIIFLIGLLIGIVFRGF